MNYIELLNMFYDLLQQQHISNNAQLLYYTLLQINNRCSWIDWFERTNVSLSGMMCISEKALINARNELKQLGLIDFVTSKKRGTCTKYTILYQTKDSTKEVQKKYKGSTKEVQSADIDKPKQIHKKSISNEIPEKDAETVKKIVSLFNDVCISLPRVTKLSESRKKTLKARLKNYTLDDFKRLFEKAESSDFLRGLAGGEWRATFDWLIVESNMVKTLEGNYDNASSGKNKPANKFCDFEQRQYDFDKLEKQFADMRNSRAKGV